MIGDIGDQVAPPDPSSGASSHAVLSPAVGCQPTVAPASAGGLASRVSRLTHRVRHPYPHPLELPRDLREQLEWADGLDQEPVAAGIDGRLRDR